MPSSRPNVVAENARREKPLSISSNGNHQPAKAETDNHADGAPYGWPTYSGLTWLTA